MVVAVVVSEVASLLTLPFPVAVLNRVRIAAATAAIDDDVCAAGGRSVSESSVVSSYVMSGCTAGFDWRCPSENCVCKVIVIRERELE